MDYFEDGFAVRTPSWHRKEKLLAEAPTIATWRQEAGVTWEPVKVPTYLPGTTLVSVDAEGLPTLAQGRPSGTYVVARNDRLELLDAEDPKDRDRAILHRAATEEYEPVEHERDMTPLLEVLFEAAEAVGTKAEFTTAGSVREGKQVFACLQLDRPIEVAGDPSLTLPYATLLNSHDGSTACRGGLTMTRVVCANTYAVADNELDGNGLYFRVKHTGNVQERLEEARQGVARWLDVIDGYQQRMDYLVGLTAGDELVADWLDEFLPIIPQRMTERQVDRRTTERAQFQALLQSVTCAEVEETVYGVWQATIEFMDHVVPWRSPDAYLRRTLLEPVPAKLQAQRRLVELATAN